MSSIGPESEGLFVRRNSLNDLPVSISNQEQQQQQFANCGS
jgi:hypothetical protein